MKRQPLETGTSTLKDLASRAKDFRDAPETTRKPEDLEMLIKRLSSLVGRKVSQFRSGNNACVLRSIITENRYPSISDYPQYPGASSYFAISAASQDANGNCQAAYKHKVPDYVS